MNGQKKTDAITVHVMVTFLEGKRAFTWLFKVFKGA